MEFVLKRRPSVRLVGLALLIAMVIGVSAYFVLRPGCDSSQPGMRGEVRREANGTLRYFDGRCWTTQPLPPRDTPF